MSRQPMTPAEFDASCRALVAACPFLSETSGRRTTERNEGAGGSGASKHLLGMARDFALDLGYGLSQAEAQAEELGLWATAHDAGSGMHLHVQGLPVGPPARWWLAKFGGSD